MGSKSLEDDFYRGLGGVLEEAPAPTSDDEARIDAIETEAAEELDKTAQQAIRPVTKSNIFSHPEAHPFVLDMALLKAFGLDWFLWEPDTLFSEVRETFSTSIADVNRVKILAASSLHAIDSFWESWEIFENTVLALNGVVPRIGYIQPPSIALLMAGVDIANSLRKEDFSDEVSRYTAACLRYEGASYAPEPLDYCRLHLAGPKYKCTHCGKTASALEPFDGRCDSCSRKFDDDHPFNFKPAEDAKDKPEWLEYFVTLDPAPTRKRYEELMALSPKEVQSQIRETPEDIEASRLIVATDYMMFRRMQRDRQLGQVKDWMGAVS